MDRSPRHIEIPVKIKVQPRPTAPSQPDQPASSKHLPVTKRKMSFNPSFAHVPLEQRRRWMWGIVAIGMFIAMSLWALSLGAELRQFSGKPSLWTQVTDIFKTFQPGANASPKQQEIRKLEKEVFPQFQ